MPLNPGDSDRQTRETSRGKLEPAAFWLIRGDYTAALGGFLLAAAEDDSNWEAWLGVGQTAAKLGRSAESLQYMRRSVELRPADPELIAVATAMERAGEAAGARTTMRRALSLDPDLAEGHNILADRQRKAGELDKALSQLRRRC